MIEIDEVSRATFDEIDSHPFFSELDFEKVIYREYQGWSTLSILAREILLTHRDQSRSLRSRVSCPAGTRPWINTGSQGTPRTDEANLCLKAIWNTTEHELHALRRMRTGGLCRRILSGIWVRRYNSLRERRVRRPLELEILLSPVKAC